MKLFEVKKGTEVHVMFEGPAMPLTEPKTMKRDMLFELEDVTIDPLHPEQLGVRTIGNCYARAGWYGFRLHKCGKYRTLLAHSRVVRIL